MSKIKFAIIGAGWRTDFFMRIAQALPERFVVTGVLVRNAEKRAAFAARWGVPVTDSLDGLLATPVTPAFAVVSVPWEAAPGLLFACTERGLPVLCETPPAPDLAGLLSLMPLVENDAKIQVAEQYPFQPLIAARLAVVASGRMGSVSQAQVSMAHGYHGFNVMRQLLGVGIGTVTLHARNFVSPLLQGPSRLGPPKAEVVENDEQTIAQLDFHTGQLGILDFTGAQYRSAIRAHRMLVRGERGEMDQHEVRWLADFATPLSAPLRRMDAGQGGNLEGYYHKGYTLGAEWLYRNPFEPARLHDDEIAIAECLVRMATYVDGGPSFMGLREASHDHYLYLLMLESAKSGERVKTERQPWM